MEENLIVENELYNSFHTQTQFCNLWLGQGRILPLRVFLLMPSNSFRLSYRTEQTPPDFFPLLFRALFFLFLVLFTLHAALGPHLSPLHHNSSRRPPWGIIRNNLKIVSVVFYVKPWFTSDSHKKNKNEIPQSKLPSYLMWRNVQIHNNMHN